MNGHESRRTVKGVRPPFDKDDASMRERAVRPMSAEELRKGEVIPEEWESEDR
jgi:hypothetical protein